MSLRAIPITICLLGLTMLTGCSPAAPAPSPASGRLTQQQIEELHRDGVLVGLSVSSFEHLCGPSQPVTGEHWDYISAIGSCGGFGIGVRVLKAEYTDGQVTNVLLGCD